MLIEILEITDNEFGYINTVTQTKQQHHQKKEN